MATAAAPSSASATPRDLVRQIVVISAFSFMIIGDAVGIGAFGGTPIQDAVGGAFDPDASYLTPATSAFSIWSLIYLGLLGYTVWQALPSQRQNARQRVVGWWIALTMVLNGGWLVTVQFAGDGGVWATVVVLALLVAALCVAYVQIVRTRQPQDRIVATALLDGATGLHLGWATLATVANVAAALTATGPASWGDAADVVGVVVIVVVVVIALVLAAWSRWSLAPGLAIGWGLVWLAVARLGGDLHSTPIGVAAIGAAGIVVLVLAGMRVLRQFRPVD